MKIALIFAAGRGERLKPMTDTLPKALCRLKQRPLIDYHLEQLAKAGFERVIVNHAYLGGQIRQHLAHLNHPGLRIDFSPEPPGALETGGALVNALKLLGDEPFITINADIYTDYDYSRLGLIATHLAHLILVPYPGQHHTKDFSLSPNHQIQNHPRTHTFAGIACYHPSLFHPLQPGRFSMTAILRDLADKQQITGELHSGIWFDIGSIERLRLAEQYLGNQG